MRDPVGERGPDGVVIFHQPREVAERRLDHPAHPDLLRRSQRVTSGEICALHGFVGEVFVELAGREPFDRDEVGQATRASSNRQDVERTRIGSNV